MKQVIIFIAVLFVSTSQVWSQATQGNGVFPATRYPMLGDDAPSFVAQSTAGKINFPKDYSGEWKVLFSHPADFTPVCSSELLQLGTLQDAFNKINTKIIVLSTDELSTHQEWLKSMETVRYQGHDPMKLEFPLVADPDHMISYKYGMMHPNTNTTKDVRGVFIIDPQNKIRAILYYPMEVGRDMAEIKRTVVALQTADQEHVLTPSDWKPGNDVLVKAQTYSPEQGEQMKKENPNYYQLTWYMTYMKLNK